MTSGAFNLGMLGSSNAGDAWTEEQKKRIDSAIRKCATTMEEFTTDDVWALVPDVPVTKGIASRLLPFVRSGMIENSLRLKIAERGGIHDHAQRLTIWRSKK